MKNLNYRRIFMWILLVQSTVFYCQNLPIIGFGDATNYTIGYYSVPGSSGLDLHWYGGIRFGDRTDSSVMQITNGSVGIGTTNPVQKLDVNGNINMAGVSGRRLFMGGAGGSTFGIAYDATYPNYGIFYTEGEPDYVSISPNGNANAGVLNVFGNGNVGVGTTNPTSKLTVAGNINSREVKVTVDAGADFVFEKDYNLPSLTFLDNYIKENKHLPEIASATEMKANGINLSEMNIKLLQKIEELTLYTIEQNKKIEKQNEKMLVLEKKMQEMELVSK